MKESADPQLNPPWPTKGGAMDGFSARLGECAALTDAVRRSALGFAPQHALVIGGRGMGKTTLLARLAHGVASDPSLGAVWRPVLWAGSHHHVGELADLWLDALHLLAVDTDQPRLAHTARDLAEAHRGDALEETARRALEVAAAGLGRRLLLLVDDFDALLDRIGDDVQHAKLREVLQHAPWLMLVGASSAPIAATYDYDRPLYAQLEVTALEPLDPEAAMRLWIDLARRDPRDGLVPALRADAAWFEVMGRIAGGNPRTLTQLFGVWRDGPPVVGAPSPLEAILRAGADGHRAQLDGLGRQTQRVFDALAQGWQAATAAEVAAILRLERGPVSAHLIRLVDRGLAARVDIGTRAVGYQIRDRLLALWCLSRSPRRKGPRVRWLTQWIDAVTRPVAGPPPGRDDGPAGAARDLQRRAMAAETDAERFEVARLASVLRGKHPDPWPVHAAVAAAELGLGRGEAAVDALGAVLDRVFDHAVIPRDVIDLCRVVARHAPASTLGMLQGSLWGDRLVCLRDALLIHFEDPHAARLPAERRLLAEDALADLDGSSGPSVPNSP